MIKSTWISLAVKSIMLTLIGLILTTFPLASQAAPLKAEPAWRAEYYDNDALSGQPRVSRYESSIGHDWGTGSPAMEIPKNHFSARWTNKFHFDEGTYLFFLTVDDGARVWLNGQLIVDAWDIGRVENLKSRIRIEKDGEYEIQVAYFDNTGNAAIDFSWLRLGGENDIVGAWNGEYFNNRNLAGNPVITRQDGGISFNWDQGSPHPKVTRDNFSIRWTRSIYLKAGIYHFRVQHDDGMRMYIDGKIVYESWFDQSVTYKTGDVPLKEGYRTFVVEYYDHTSNAIAQLSFDQDPGDYSDVETTPGGTGVIVDNDSSRFEWLGPEKHRATSSDGFDGGSYWTHNTTTTSVNAGRWTPGLSSAGNYEVFAYIPGDRSTTANAVYRIQHYGRVAERSLNQGNYSDKFVSLGIYYFSGDGNEFVTLRDNTGESGGSTTISFDALRFVKK